MAGMVGCIAAVRRPELFRRLVLLGASPRYLNVEGYEGGFAMPELESVFTNIESRFTSWAGGFARLVVGEGYPAAAEKFARSVLRMRPEVALAVAKAVFLSDLRKVLDRVQVPCAVISGANDPVVPVSVAHDMRSKIKGEVAPLEILDFDGHFPQLVACRLLVDALDRIRLG
ncbi:hypothetical protein Taro_038989 [Colocasia esculenta]|uniref:Uncharacterized protein n=1 Tax=Colocasia esculenta TaxID=4460 RepID=A0A843WQ76_COLES|nr:hypothetical protein [Colocasia esculenta]